MISYVCRPETSSGPNCTQTQHWCLSVGQSQEGASSDELPETYTVIEGHNILLNACRPLNDNTQNQDNMLADFYDVRKERPPWYGVYNDVTSLACQRLCSVVHDATCSAICYDRKEKICYLTSQLIDLPEFRGDWTGTEGEQQGESTLEHYRRLRNVTGRSFRAKHQQFQT